MSARLTYFLPSLNSHLIFSIELNDALNPAINLVLFTKTTFSFAIIEWTMHDVSFSTGTHLMPFFSTEKMVVAPDDDCVVDRLLKEIRSGKSLRRRSSTRMPPATARLSFLETIVGSPPLHCEEELPLLESSSETAC